MICLLSQGLRWSAQRFTLTVSGLDAATRIGLLLDRPYFLALLADILATDRQFDRALAAIDEAQQQASRSRSFFYEAELWRMRGTMLLEAYGPQRAREADDCLEQAVRTATRQGARILLLRAQLSRVRARGASPGADDTVKALAALHASFEEGVGTVDLLEAARFIRGATAAMT
jgi:predicted ATPase